MPILDVKTVSAKQVWQTADKQRTIWELQLEYEGKPVKAQTFSESIATPGWAGKVETYERGNNTFVKQPPKEDSPYGGSNRTATPGSRSSGYPAKDEKAIQAMWSIGQSVVLHGQMQTGTNIELDFIERYAQDLFLMVDRVKVVTDEPEPEAVTATPESSDGAGDDVVIENVPDDISTIFDDAEAKAEQVDVGEDPWKPST